MGRTRTTRVFMFTDIVDSTRLAETLGDEAWDSVIRLHDKAVRAAVAEQGGEEVKATGDGFFLAFADADQAIEAAVTIQRRLAEQRAQRASRWPCASASMGPRPTAWASTTPGLGSTRPRASAVPPRAARSWFRGDPDRRAALIRGGGRRTVELKGLSAPVEVVSVQWR